MDFELVGAAEIAGLLGVSTQRVDRISRTHADFPLPVATLSAGRIWKLEDVEAWAVATGRLKPKRSRKTPARS